MVCIFNDKYGSPLSDNQIYVAGDKIDAHFFYVRVKEDGTFFAVGSDGIIPIQDQALFARQLMPLANPKSELEFAVRTLRGMPF